MCDGLLLWANNFLPPGADLVRQLARFRDNGVDQVSLAAAAGFWGALGLPDYDPINAPFFALLDWEAVRVGCGASVTCYAGDDDPYVPLRFSREIAERLGSPLQIIPGGKHLNAENGMTTFPELAPDLDALCRATIKAGVVP